MSPLPSAFPRSPASLFVNIELRAVAPLPYSCSAWFPDRPAPRLPSFKAILRCRSHRSRRSSVTYTAAQTAGNLNVIAVGWNDSTAVVNSVTDSSGNVYTRAVGPTAVAGALSQSIYYAKNIAAAGANANSRDGAIQRSGAIRRCSHSRVQRHRYGKPGRCDGRRHRFERDQQHDGGGHHQRQRPALRRQHGGHVHERARRRIHESGDHDAQMGTLRKTAS